MTKLCNWSFIDGHTGLFVDPKLQRCHLTGMVYEDNRFHDGVKITTSGVEEYSLPIRIATTRNTKYILDGIDPNYNRWCDEHYVVLNGMME